jgi:membrane protease YdiL (CAAX protease family)
MRIPHVPRKTATQFEASSSVAQSADWRSWLPLTRDPVLVAERQGQWPWYWALVFTLAFVPLTIIALYVLEDFFVKIAAGVGIFIEPRAVSSETLYVPGNIDTYIADFTVSAAVIIAVLAVLRLRDRRAGWGFTYGAPVYWQHFWKAAGALFVILAITNAITYVLDPGAFSLNRYGAFHIIWLGLAVPLILMQTLAEELLFRSFLLRVWGAVFPYRLALVTVTGGIFVAIHAENPDARPDPWFFLISFAISMIPYYWILFRTRSIMAGWGMHWANNVSFILFLATKPGWNNEIAIFTYGDPALSQDESYLFDVYAYLVLLMQNVIFVALAAWKRSPFYIAPVAALPEQTVLPDNELPDAAAQSGLAPDSTQA